MIILPDRSLSRGKLLMPIPKWQWREPSVALGRDQFNNKVVRTFFRLTARLADGHIVWRGKFEDRDDADAFMFALVSGSLRYERALWELPTPAWHPNIGTDLTYRFDTYTYLSSPTGSNETYNLPSDWNNSNNTIYNFGAGGSGGWATSSAVGRVASGGGGGAFSSVSNLTLSASATYQIGTFGASVVTSTNSSTQANGNIGGDTWFNGTTLAGSSVGAKGGGAGGSAAGATATGGAGGASASGVGSVKYSGGNGGNAITTGSASPSTGGGGSGGPSGNGVNAANSSTTTATAGGRGNNSASGSGTGGTAGGATGGNGGSGTEINSAVGSGGGGGGGLGNNVNATGGNAGSYGGGGGAAVIYNRSTTRTTTTGSGGGGLIVVQYVPQGLSLANINLAMMGM